METDVEKLRSDHASSKAGAVMTARIDLPVEALTVVAAPPALLTQHNLEHLGLTKRQLLDVLRAMRRDPRFAPEVVVFGKAVRGASPEAILAFLRASQALPSSSSAPSMPANDAAPVDEVEALAESLGLKRVSPAEPKRAGRGRR